jgi:ATP-binding cassette, subfamily B (MDR/TAP), member 1
MSALDLQKQTS